MVKVVQTKSYYNQEKGTTVVAIVDDFNNMWKGKSQCSVNDTYDKNFGEKLAYLRAKRKMIRYYKKANEKQLEITRKNMVAFEKRMDAELSKHQNILDNIEKAIDDMLQF